MVLVVYASGIYNKFKTNGFILGEKISDTGIRANFFTSLQQMQKTLMAFQNLCGLYVQQQANNISREIGSGAKSFMRRLTRG